MSKIRNHKDYYGDKKYEMVAKDKIKAEDHNPDAHHNKKLLRKELV